MLYFKEVKLLKIFKHSYLPVINKLLKAFHKNSVLQGKTDNVLVKKPLRQFC